MGVRDHERRAEPGPGGRTEEIGIRERVPEHALVGGPGRGEHRADEEPERDARRADLPEDGVLGLCQRRLHVQERHVAQQLAADRAQAEIDRPDGESDESGRDDATEPRREPPCAQPRQGRPTPLPNGDHVPASWNAWATISAKSTMRGPQREAMSSSTGTTSPPFTAES